jgi:CRISPR-associated endonuclease Csn1
MKKWYLGLDIGTNSVGFCATDTYYNILKKNGKLQCGSRLFKNAKDASKRRLWRSSRRRSARRKFRIDLLQELFDEEISKKDESFFIRLNESYLHQEDRSANYNYPLFNDVDFTDKQYYKKFPTIYHLRQHLLNNDESDIRLLYLACHHLIKYRGHFLFSQFNTKQSKISYSDIIKTINDNLRLQEFDCVFEQINNEEIRKLLLDKSKTVKEQLDVISKILNPNADKRLKAIFKTINGDKISLKDIWKDLKEAEKEFDNLKDFKFSSENYDECLVRVESILSEDRLEMLKILKLFYDSICLDRVLDGSDYISESMVKRYKEHHEDLKILKCFIKEHIPDEYSNMFCQNINKEGKNGSYGNYIGSNLTHNKKVISHCKISVGDNKGKEPMTANHDTFLKYTKEIIEQVSPDAKLTEDYKYLIKRIDNKALCKIQNTQDNSYIPYQLLEKELSAILNRQKKNFPFIDSVFDKIKSLLTFRIPYYVGPLSEKDKGKFAWIEKKEGFEKQQVLPWNFDEIVDKAKSGENFILRMTSKCTYLRTEDVIPKQSLLYQKYMLLNDLNNLKINGNRISQELKEFLYNGICQTAQSLTKDKIKKYLIEQGKIDKNAIVGKENANDLAFNSSLSSYIKFKEILGDKFDEKMCENIIKWHTVFGDIKEPVLDKIKDFYGDRLTDEQIHKIGKLKFRGWARLSEKFLNGITTTYKKTGETALTIIQLLKDTTLNLMEILNNDNYIPKFLEIVDNSNAGNEDIKVDYDLISELYCSPTVKRSIWQSILVSKELAKINGCAPKKVFVEVTRAEDKSPKGKMEASRRKQIEKFLNEAAKTKDEKIKKDIITLKEKFKNKEANEFRADRLYLYFMQLGKCMYTGEPIDLDSLNNPTLYDIDHIYPKSKILDNSLDNRVLVKRIVNANKEDVYPISSEIQSKMSGFWNMLKEKNLISSKKYDRLICTKPLSDDIIGGFINRQLVSTNQAVKETIKVLKILFGNEIKIVYSKANNVSNFRQQYKLIKSRKVNNLHHAHDAYLNIVVGNVWSSHYSWYKDNYRKIELDKMFSKPMDGVWMPNYIEKIKTYVTDNKKYLDKFVVTTRPFEKKGEFYKQTIHPKGKGQYELHKGLDTKKYGGYKDGYTAYNCIIEYSDKNGKRIKGIFSVPVRYTYLEREKKYDELLKIITTENGIADKDPKVLISKILMFSVLEIDGVRYHMRSGVNPLQCSVTAEWYPDKEIIQIVHDISKFKENENKNLYSDQIEKWKKTMDDIVFYKREQNPKIKESKMISRVNNLKLYDAIIEQVKKPFYANYGFAKKVLEGKIEHQKFEALPTYEQMTILISLLNVITTNGTAATASDASKIGGSKNETNKYLFRGCNDITTHNIYLITQSVTGLFENRIEINKVC